MIGESGSWGGLLLGVGEDEHQAEQEAKDRDEASHSLMSPPGSLFLSSAWTARVWSATFLVALVSLSIEKVRTSPALTPLGSKALGKLACVPSSFRRTATCFLSPSKRSMVS